MIYLSSQVFFILRKKFNQVSFLHVYHHTITALFSWCYLKFLPGEQGIVIGFLNSFVHIVMYSYYLIAALGPEYRKYLWWKKYMTWMQLVSFFDNFNIYHSRLFLRLLFKYDYVILVYSYVKKNFWLHFRLEFLNAIFICKRAMIIDF